MILKILKKCGSLSSWNISIRIKSSKPRADLLLQELFKEKKVYPAKERGITYWYLKEEGIKI